MAIVAAGDVFPNQRFYVDGEPLSRNFRATLELIGRADIRFANFEMPLSRRGRPLDKLATIRADPGIAEDVGRVGLDVVSLANNHAFDYGLEALTDTIELLDGLKVRHTGAGESLAVATRPVILERAGWRVGFLAFTCLIPPGGAASPDRPGVAPIHIHSSYEVNPYWAIEEPGEPAMVAIHTRADEADQRFAEEQIRELRGDVDVLCVSVHWGYGASADLAEYQRPLGRALIDAGADLVLGHHVHAVQGIELYRGRPILYSPGTFIGRQAPDDPAGLSELVKTALAAMSPDGFVAEIVVGEQGLAGFRLIPIAGDENGLPILAEGAARDRIASRVTEHSRRLGTIVAFTDGALVAVGAQTSSLVR